MTERHFEHYVFDSLIRKRLDEYLDRKRRRGFAVEMIERPFKGLGVHPVAVIKVDGGTVRLFFSVKWGRERGRWKVRSRRVRILVPPDDPKPGHDLPEPLAKCG